MNIDNTVNHAVEKFFNTNGVNPAAMVGKIEVVLKYSNGTESGTVENFDITLGNLIHDGYNPLDMAILPKMQAAGQKKSKWTFDDNFDGPGWLLHTFPEEYKVVELSQYKKLITSKIHEMGTKNKLMDQLDAQQYDFKEMLKEIKEVKKMMLEKTDTKKMVEPKKPDTKKMVEPKKPEDRGIQFLLDVAVAPPADAKEKVAHFEKRMAELAEEPVNPVDEEHQKTLVAKYHRIAEVAEVMSKSHAVLLKTAMIKREADVAPQVATLPRA